MSFKSAVVERAIPVSYDLGNLAVADTNPLEFTDDLEESLYEVTRGNVQLLVNQILQLPLKRTTDSVNSSSTQDSSVSLFRLPEPVWPLPREKPVPKVKAMTKWEQFALKKGIKKKAKDGKLVFDEDSQKWVPKWGYGGINKKMDEQWLVEYDKPSDKNKRSRTADEDLIDPRKLNRDERKRLVKKNAVQQKRNAQRAEGR